MSDRDAEIEADILEDVAAHWFLQGGEAEFGAICRRPLNADVLVAEILARVRAARAPADSVRVMTASESNAPRVAPSEEGDSGQ